MRKLYFPMPIVVLVMLAAFIIVVYAFKSQRFGTRRPLTVVEHSVTSAQGEVMTPKSISWRGARRGEDLLRQVLCLDWENSHDSSTGEVSVLARIPYPSGTGIRRSSKEERLPCSWPLIKPRCSASRAKQLRPVFSHCPTSAITSESVKVERY